MKTNISPMAIVETGAVLGNNVEVGPWTIIRSGAVIGDNTIIAERCTIGNFVKIGENNKIASDVHITGKTTIKDFNWILSGAKLGERPQDISDPYVANLPTEECEYTSGRLEIGSYNKISENTVINVGEEHKRHGDVTRIGDRCFIMDLVKIGHNCQIGFSDYLPQNPKAKFDTILCSGVKLAGFAQVRRGAYVSTNASVHHFRIVGEGARPSLGERIVRDILPFSIVIKGRGANIFEKAIVEFCGEDNYDKEQVQDALLDLSGIEKRDLEKKHERAKEILARYKQFMPHPAAIIAAFVLEERNGYDTTKWK